MGRKERVNVARRKMELECIVEDDLVTHGLSRYLVVMYEDVHVQRKFKFR